MIRLTLLKLGQPSEVLLPFNELPDNGKNREHRVRIRDADRDNHDRRDPRGGPGNKHNQQDMQRHYDSHREPEPSTSPEVPLYCDDKTKHHAAKQYWPCKIKSSQII